MSFQADLTQEQLTEILKKGLYTDIQKAVEDEFIKLAQMEFDTKIKPTIKEKVEKVVRHLTKVTTQMYKAPDTEQLIVQIEIR